MSIYEVYERVYLFSVILLKQDFRKKNILLFPEPDFFKKGFFFVLLKINNYLLYVYEIVILFKDCLVIWDCSDLYLKAQVHIRYISSCVWIFKKIFLSRFTGS